ncbi:hypothetical protein D3C81_1749790 [compost metagenome]
MAGVAAQLCNNPDSNLKTKIENELKNVKWGKRKAIINDLSPIASFLSYNYNSSINREDFLAKSNRILDDCER